MGAIRLLSQTASLSNTYPFHCIRIERGRSYRSGFNRFSRTKEREGTKNERESDEGGRVGRGKFQRISNSQLFSIATAFDASFVRQRGRRMRIEG